MNILTIDIGNTRTTFGVFKGTKLVNTTHIPSSALASSTKSMKYIRQLLRKCNVSQDKLSGVAISSVVPSLTKKLLLVLKRELHIHPLVISGNLNVGLRIGYDNPVTLGADRICNAVAAYHKYGGPIIVIDAGTATTFDVVSKNGTFLGGAIAPGILTAASALNQRTAQLPAITLQFPKCVIEKTTIGNIQSGILYGAIDMMEGMIKRIKSITGQQTKVILTGGFSNLLKKKTRVVNAVEPTLVLEGARLIFERIQRSSQ